VQRAESVCRLASVYINGFSTISSVDLGGRKGGFGIMPGVVPNSCANCEITNLPPQLLATVSPSDGTNTHLELPPFLSLLQYKRPVFVAASNF
jgi:hypothetical protein